MSCHSSLELVSAAGDMDPGAATCVCLETGSAVFNFGDIGDLGHEFNVGCDDISFQYGGGRQPSRVGNQINPDQSYTYHTNHTLKDIALV